MTTKLFFFALLLASSSVFATSPPSETSKPTSAIAGSTSVSASASVAQASSESTSASTSVSHGGNSVATGGEASQSQTALGGDASNNGNSQATTINQSAPRNAPSVAQGSLIPSGCGVAGNAGGSGVNGSGFLGIAFTTDECYKFLLAQSFSAIGMPDTACDVLLTTKAARKAFKGKTLPSCTTAENKEEALSGERKEGTATKDYVNEVVDRALKSELSK